MPTYEYECKECGHNFEVFQTMSEEPLKNCPECGKELRRLIFGGAGVIFKGSGFYVTDKAGGKTGGSMQKKPAAAPGADAKGDNGSKGDNSSKGDAASAEKNGDSAQKKPAAKSA